MESHPQIIGWFTNRMYLYLMWLVRVQEFQISEWLLILVAQLETLKWLYFHRVGAPHWGKAIPFKVGTEKRFKITGCIWKFRPVYMIRAYTRRYKPQGERELLIIPEDRARSNRVKLRKKNSSWILGHNPWNLRQFPSMQRASTKSRPHLKPQNRV